MTPSMSMEGGADIAGGSTLVDGADRNWWVAQHIPSKVHRQSIWDSAGTEQTPSNHDRGGGEPPLSRDVNNLQAQKRESPASVATRAVDVRTKGILGLDSRGTFEAGPLIILTVPDQPCPAMREKPCRISAG